MNKELPIIDTTLESTFEKYEAKYKAIADKKRLQIMYEMTQQGEVCVCDLSDKLGLPQSKLSYHLKILLDANIIEKETRGTWSYYRLNNQEVNHLLSEELCCLFRPSQYC
ncbi:ArsR/SmtB family transcription factor [Pseudalkalibacillus caeni]|uniref:Winged helix-turn-helix transcriptional regulator n=1 Tax=Exobacillus caeni TaxID=2574798 RepID=A0A5R9F489_9BACL|nr:metalloregulator ArsR/SmtB family transcription factor [Pseudalkalibacillus caeni]TLS37166.1 winged helix-turn-helix transcriptional regulator [Pseudalkalibacillus caeni]